jgi:hypothetical protein
MPECPPAVSLAARSPGTGFGCQVGRWAPRGGCRLSTSAAEPEARRLPRSAPAPADRPGGPRRGRPLRAHPRRLRGGFRGTYSLTSPAAQGGTLPCARLDRRPRGSSVPRNGAQRPGGQSRRTFAAAGPHVLRPRSPAPARRRRACPCLTGTRWPCAPSRAMFRPPSLPPQQLGLAGRPGTDGPRSSAAVQRAGQPGPSVTRCGPGGSSSPSLGSRARLGTDLPRAVPCRPRQVPTIDGQRGADSCGRTGKTCGFFTSCADSKFGAPQAPSRVQIRAGATRLSDSGLVRIAHRKRP